MTSAGPGPRATPGWAVAVAILGWLIVGLAVLAFILVIAAMEVATHLRPGRSDIGTLIGLGGLGIWIVCIGWLLVIVGRSRRPNAKSSRLKLWAECVIVPGVMLCVGLPVLLIGAVISTRGGDDLGIEVAGGFGLVIGIAMIASAIVWGRRKPPPDLAHVFN